MLKKTASVIAESKYKFSCYVVLAVGVPPFEISCEGEGAASEGWMRFLQRVHVFVGFIIHWRSYASCDVTCCRLSPPQLDLKLVFKAHLPSFNQLPSQPTPYFRHRMEIVLNVLSLILAALVVFNEILFLWEVIQNPNNDHQEPEGTIELAELVPTEE